MRTPPMLVLVLVLVGGCDGGSSGAASPGAASSGSATNAPRPELEVRTIDTPSRADAIFLPQGFELRADRPGTFVYEVRDRGGEPFVVFRQHTDGKGWEKVVAEDTWIQPAGRARPEPGKVAITSSTIFAPRVGKPFTLCIWGWKDPGHDLDLQQDTATATVRMKIDGKDVPLDASPNPIWQLTATFTPDGAPK
jgi:hypothetical protein